MDLEFMKKFRPNELCIKVEKLNDKVLFKIRDYMKQ